MTGKLEKRRLSSIDMDGTSDSQRPSRVRLNVGGKYFLTTYETLSNPHNQQKPTYFSGITSGCFKEEYDELLKEPYYFIDRDPTHFRYILNYLRDGNVNCIPQKIELLREILQESSFYAIEGLNTLLERELRALIDTEKLSASDEKEYKLFTDLSSEEFENAFEEWVKRDGFDVVSVAYDSKRETYTLILSKYITRGDMFFVKRLMQHS